LRRFVGEPDIGQQKRKQSRHQPSDWGSGTITSPPQHQSRHSDQKDGVADRIDLSQDQRQRTVMVGLDDWPEQEVPDQGSGADGDHAKV